ncbi:MAG: DUF6320 domain-containing protein [Sediminispirochaetaceae bacterium]
MPICPNCGVRVEDDQKKCPLCGTSLTADRQGGVQGIEQPASPRERIGIPRGGKKSEPGGETKAGRETEPGGETKPGGETEPGGPPSGIEGDAEREERVRILFGEVISFIALAGAVVVFAVDYAYGMRVSWSRFPLISIAFFWLLVSIPYWLRGRGYLIVLLETIDLIVFLYLLDLFTPSAAWFTGLALPIAAGLGVISMLAMGCIRLFRLSVLGSVSTVLVALGLYMLWLEWVINYYVYDHAYVSWSLVAAAAAVPIIVFLITYNSRLKRHGSNLKKHFHV